MKILFAFMGIFSFIIICLGAYGMGGVLGSNSKVTVAEPSPAPYLEEEDEPTQVVQEQYTAPQQRVVYVTATPLPTKSVQAKSYTYQEAKIDCSYSDGKYSYNYGQLTYSECQMKANTYWAQEKAKTNTTNIGSYQSQPVNVQFNNPPTVPTVPVGYGYSN